MLLIDFYNEKNRTNRDEISWKTKKKVTSKYGFLGHRMI